MPRYMGTAMRMKVIRMRYKESWDLGYRENDVRSRKERLSQDEDIGL